MKKSIIFLICLFFSFSVYAEGTKWFKGTYEEALSKSKKEDKLILIEFFKYS